MEQQDASTTTKGSETKTIPLKGWLRKQGSFLWSLFVTLRKGEGKFLGWKKRYFKQDEKNDLFYFKTEADSTDYSRALGSIAISQVPQCFM